MKNKILKLILLLSVGMIIFLSGCSKDGEIAPEPNINLTDWANYGNTIFQVDTNFINTDTL